MSAEVVPMSGFAEDHGVSAKLVSELVKRHHIPTHKVRHSPNGKGIDGDAQAKLRKLLNIPDPVAAAS